jgi:serine/threonine protein kinase
MNDEQWRAAWNVYERACLLPAGERRTFVETEIVDLPLRRKVISLLERADESEDSKLACEIQVPDWPLLGQTIGRFVVTAPLGRGGMGDVYMARDQELNRMVAMKFVSPGSIGTAGVDRFMNEAQAASALNHPGIVTVHEVIRHESTLAIVMELVEGKSFRDLSGKPNAPQQVSEWGRQMAEALAAAHARRILHRDVKPDNVMLRNDNRVRFSTSVLPG